MSLLKTLFIAMALSPTTILAAPAPTPDLDISPRCGGGSTADDGGEPTISVYLCKDKNWGGDCYNSKGHLDGVCYTLPSEWNDEISSFHTYDYPCKFYVDDGCVGTPLESSVTHMDLGPEGWNDKITSYSCTKKPTTKC